MSVPTLRPNDFAIAGIPTVATLTLSQIHTIVGIVGGVLGIAYLLWKWRKEAGK